MQEMEETQVQSLGREKPLKESMVTHSSILAWETPWTEEPSRLQFMGLQRVGHEWAWTHAYVFLITEVLCLEWGTVLSDSPEILKICSYWHINFRILATLLLGQLLSPFFCSYCHLHALFKALHFPLPHCTAFRTAL